MTAPASQKRPLYLDHHATTPLDARVLDAMMPWLTEDFGNAASSTHIYGWRAEAAVEDARERIAQALGAEPREIVFTSGATESNNLALFGVTEAQARRGRHVLTVETEHPAVLDPCRVLEARGAEVTRLRVDRDGRIDPAALADGLRDDTVLVSVMAANNEIGVLHPIAEIAALCRERGIAFHSDAAQAVGRIALDLASMPIDLLSISGHKIYGPKGIGVLFVRRRPRVRLQALQYGGGHEGGLRSGTLAVPLIVGLARALELVLEEREAEAARLRGLRDRLLEGIEAGLDGVRVNGALEERLPGNLNLSFEGVDGARLLLALPGLAVSSGSACASAKPGPSHVLLALGLSEAMAGASLRFGLGRGTEAPAVLSAVDQVVDAVRKVRAEG